MCLAIPGKILHISRSEGDVPMATVDFGGVRKSVCTEWVEAVPGDYILAHAGIALCKVDREEAKKTLETFHMLAKHVEENDPAHCF